MSTYQVLVQAREAEMAASSGSRVDGRMGDRPPIAHPPGPGPRSRLPSCRSLHA
ncbi:MAG: hypothetical protein SFW36_02205 [Leptolyngbyaceae cyanobacterium bins.59]|nr:hypothetical protein [Leptolyngbyaceae cyanobacterium bins.59]